MRMSRFAGAAVEVFCVVAYRLRWSGNEYYHRDACGSVSELTGAVGLFYILLICLGLLFVTLEKLQLPDASASQNRIPQATLFQALLPFDSGR